MKIPIVTYKNSAAANIFSIGGAVLLFIGVILFKSGEILKGIVTVLIGAATIFITMSIVDKNAETKRNEILNNPELINAIKTSSIQALALFQKLPNQETLNCINVHNSYAAQKIIQIINKEITSEEAIKEMRIHDMEAYEQ